MESIYREGVVSVWLSQKSDTDSSVDVMRDLCGVEYYDSDRTEGWASDDNKMIDVADLLRPLSYSGTYIDSVVLRAQELGIVKAIWSVVQYDLAYDPLQAICAESEPRFIGYFPYSKDNLKDY